MADVEMVIDALRQTSVEGQWVVILRGKSAERYLPVYVGLSQAETIKRELVSAGTPRPLDEDLIYKDIVITYSEVKAVRIHKFEGNRFTARLILDTSEVDCPTATALAIAVRTSMAIFTDEVVLDKAGISFFIGEDFSHY